MMMKRDHWREDAKCLGVEHTVFFPPTTHFEDRFDAAKNVCEGCTVRKQCLQLVINLDESDDRWGVFGGKTPNERKKLREQRRLRVK